MEDRVEPVVARRADPVKPLRVAWTRETLDRGNDIVMWRGRVAVPHAGGAAIYATDGTLERTMPAPDTRVRLAHAVVSWPDEMLVLGLDVTRAFAVVWEDAAVAIDLERTSPPWYELAATGDGAILVSVSIAALPQEPDAAWTIDRRLDGRYRGLQRWALDDFTFAAACVERSGRRRWLRDGRVACVADDVVVLEWGGGPDKQIVACRAHDGAELWRRPAADRFVLGGIPMPAWSDDRVFVLDRGARRRAAWAREAEIAAIHGLSPRSPGRVLALGNLVARTRSEIPLTEPSYLCCLSTRTGDELWRAAVDGDIVSLHARPRWVAVVTEHALHCWLPDGTPRRTVPMPTAIPDGGWWPAPPQQLPAIAGGDDDHVVLVDQARLRCVALDRAMVGWEVALPTPAIRTASYGFLRTTNRATVAIAEDAAFVRWGTTITGLLPSS